MDQTQTKKILILGGGFAGVRAALDLANLGSQSQIVLISNTHNHCFVPDLYQVATAYLKNPKLKDFKRLRGTVDIHLEEIFKDKGVEVIVDEVMGVDLTQKQVNL